MNTNLRMWLPIALCCLPGVAVAAVVALGLALGRAAFGSWLGGPLGVGIVGLAMLACPLSMGLTMWRQRAASQKPASAGNAPAVADCCAPGQLSAPPEAPASAGRLVELRARREALERELAEMRTQAE